MFSQAPSESPLIDSDNPIDLKTVFKHSAGLRVARFVTREYIKAGLRRSLSRSTVPPLAQNTFLSVSSRGLDWSPDFKKGLEEKMVFRESEPMIVEQGRLGRSGFSQTSSGGFDMFRERSSLCWQALLEDVIAVRIRILTLHLQRISPGWNKAICKGIHLPITTATCTMSLTNKGPRSPPPLECPKCSLHLITSTISSGASRSQ